jgi:RHS repeat-associated protein
MAHLCSLLIRSSLGAQHLYGAERTSTSLSDHLGVHYTGEDWDAAMADEDLTPDPGVVGVTASGLFYFPSTNTFMVGQSSFKGRKNYELTNHTSTTLSDRLGNVMAVVSDKLTKYSVVEAGVIPYSLPNMVSATDYDPFGMALEQRQWQLSGVEAYSFSFNGKIEDAEILDRGRWQDYGFRAYRPDLGRFVSVDPLSKDYPELTPYQFASNTPIQAIDLDGLEAYLPSSPQQLFLTAWADGFEGIASQIDRSISVEAKITTTIEMSTGTRGGITSSRGTENVTTETTRPNLSGIWFNIRYSPDGIRLSDQELTSTTTTSKDYTYNQVQVKGPKGSTGTIKTKMNSSEVIVETSGQASVTVRGVPLTTKATVSRSTEKTASVSVQAANPAAPDAAAVVTFKRDVPKGTTSVGAGVKTTSKAGNVTQVGQTTLQFTVHD